MNIPKADKKLIEQANNFLIIDTGLFHAFNQFCAKEMIGKEMLHSDRWSMIYDWLEEQNVDKPEGIETALTEWFETTCIHVKKLYLN